MMKRFLVILFLGLFLCTSIQAKTSWIKFPLGNKEFINFNINTAEEVGPNQFKIEQVMTKENKKTDYEKDTIETLVKHCGKEVGEYKAPKKLFSRGPATKNPEAESKSGAKPGEIKVLKGGVVLFEIPYYDIEGFVTVFCMPSSYKGLMKNMYTLENEKDLIRDNIQRLYKEEITMRYQDCRRKMWGVELSDGVHWVKIEPGSNGEIWGDALCKILDK